MALPNSIDIYELLKFKADMNSGNGTMQANLTTQYKSDVSDAIDDVVEESGGIPEDYDPPTSPILDISGAQGVLAGIGNAIGVLAPTFQGAAGQFLKSLIDEMSNWMPGS